MRSFPRWIEITGPFGSELDFHSCVWYLGCKVEYKDGRRETVSLSEMRCMLADGLVWAKSPGKGSLEQGVSTAEWLPGQRYRHNTLCRHELGRRVAGFACVRLFPSGQIIWVPNKPHSLLPFEENLERLGKPTAVRSTGAAFRKFPGA